MLLWTWVCTDLFMSLFSVLLGINSEMGLLAFGDSVFNLWGTSIPFSIAAMPVSILTSHTQGFSLSTSSPALGVICFFGRWFWRHEDAWLRFEGVSPFPCMQDLACPLCRFQDHGNSFTYTGSGGRDLSGNKRTAEQSCDQKLTNTNRFVEQSVTVSQAHVCLVLGWLYRGGAVFCFGGIHAGS